MARAELAPGFARQAADGDRQRPQALYRYIFVALDTAAIAAGSEALQRLTDRATSSASICRMENAKSSTLSASVCSRIVQAIGGAFSPAAADTELEVGPHVTLNLAKQAGQLGGALGVQCHEWVLGCHSVPQPARSVCARSNIDRRREDVVWMTGAQRT